MKTASWKNNILRTALLAVTVCALPALAGPDNVGLGTGRDGALSVTTGSNTVINVYAQVTAPLAPGDTAILFANVAPVGGTIATGDLVMVLQTTGIVPEPPSGGPSPIDLTNNPVGRWEFARVASVAGNTLNLTAPLIHSYAGNVTQIIRVPEYTTANIGFGRSISPLPWDRTTNTGGVVAFLATGAFSNSGSVDARSRGFRGGQPVDDPTAMPGCSGLDEPAPQGGQKGEGIAVTRYGATVTGRGRVGNGGGGGVCFKSGGGGGGNGGVGGQGGNTDLADGNRAVGGEGGAALTYSLLNRVTLGGGGGAGHSTEVSTGTGGGIIFIRAGSLTFAGNFFASGNTSGSATDAASGGGAGGTIYLRIAGAATCGTIQAAGGAGGSTGSASIGPGGGGGGGQILFQRGSGSCNLTGTSVLGANPGTQLDPGAPGGASYGATAGAIGVTLPLAGGFPVLPTPVVNTPANGSRTNDNTPTYSGTISVTPALPAGTEVAIFVDGVEVGRVTPDALGNWTLTPTAPLASGSHSVTAVAINTAQAVQSANSNTNTFIVDVMPPAVEVMTPAEGSRTNDNTPTYSGTVSDDGPGPLTVAIRVDGTLLGNATVTGNTWTFTPTVPLAEGQHTVTATATDAAGNTASDSNTFTVDTTAPTVVVTTPAEGSRTNDTTPAYSGTVEAGATVVITVDGMVLGNATVTGTTWTFTPTVPLGEGSHTVMATATDAAGNTANDSNTFTVDLTAPAVAVTTPAEGSSTNDTTPTYSGTVEAGATVVITVDGVVLGNATVTGTTWTFTPTVPLVEGQHTVTATATDEAGNTASDSNDFRVDLTAPAVAVTAPAEGSRTNDNTPTYSGTVSDNGPGPITVVITVDGVVLGNATVTGNTWTFTPTEPLGDGPHTVTATATDAAGNTANDSNNFTVDTTAPAVEVTAPAEGSRTNDTTPTYSGTVEAGATVVISVDGTVLGNATVTGTTWTFTPTVPLAEGQHTVTATATDVAGNTASDSNTFTVDTTAPTVEVVAPAEGARTNDNTPVFFGTVEAGATVIITVDGVVLGNATVTGTMWTFTPTVPLADGEHTVTATATDAAGNISPRSNTNTFTVDATIPAAPVITGPANNTVTSDNTPPISGTAPPNSTVTVIIDGTPVGNTTSDAAGNWTFTPTVPLAEGPHDITATTTNNVGNTSPPSNTVRIVVDTGVPDTTIVSGPSGNTESTSATFTFSSSEAGVTYECSLDGASYVPCSNPAIFADLAEGEHTLLVRARDAAGNVDPSPAMATWTVVRATPPPVGDRDFLGDGIGCAASGGDPSSLAMMGLGLLAVLLVRRRRQQ